MRVLVATTAGSGHLGPLVPFARAVRDGGHEVVVAAPASFRPAVERAGFRHEGFADAPEEELQAVFRSLAGASNDEGNAVVAAEVFGRIDTGAALPGMRALVARWRPDLVLREMSELSSFVVAEEEGLPHAQVAVGLASFEDQFLPFVEAPLAALGAPGALAGLRSAPRLSLLPRSFEEPSLSVEATSRFRDDADGPAGKPLPDWWGGSAEPLVYVTFGSVAAGLGLFPALYRDVLTALAGVPVRVLLTVGDAGDPEMLRPLPPNVHVERWWPQHEVMPHAAAIVGHGGFGTTLAALSSGVPMVVVPLFADQPHNARRVAAVGAGTAIEGGPSAVGALPDALARVLDDGSFRRAAERVADEIASLPPVSEAVPLLESLAASPH